MVSIVKSMELSKIVLTGHTWKTSNHFYKWVNFGDFLCYWTPIPIWKVSTLKGNILLPEYSKCPKILYTKVPDFFFFFF